jgi:hypothetical protein
MVFDIVMMVFILWIVSIVPRDLTFRETLWFSGNITVWFLFFLYDFQHGKVWI